MRLSFIILPENHSVSPSVYDKPGLVLSGLSYADGDTEQFPSKIKKRKRTVVEAYTKACKKADAILPYSSIHNFF